MSAEIGIDADRFHLRSYLCLLGHELRITSRCVKEDLGEPTHIPFEELTTRHGIVNAFRRERSRRTVGEDALRPNDGKRSLTVLRHTNDWRGVTWHQDRNGVVWLCACARHRSGEDDDAFPYFKGLRDRGRIWPTDEDYEAYSLDQARRFVDFIKIDAPQLLARARAAPGLEHAARLGMRPIAMVVLIVETLEETFVAISGLNLIPQEFLALRAALYPDAKFSDWRQESRLPTRDLDLKSAEICFSIVH
jgi:hypothetical protein